jgi:hypothetical protein
VSAAPLPLFAYGTLMDDSFVSGILERAVRGEPARLPDFELLTIEGFPWPTAFHAQGAAIEGRLYRGLTESDYERLDAYEGVGEELYQRVEVAAAGEGGAPEPTFVYLPTEKTLRRYGAL